MRFAFLNTRGWNEEKWRLLLKEGESIDMIGVGETGWHDRVQWQEGGWLCIGRGRKVGEKKGGGVGAIVKERAGRKVTEVGLSEETENNLGYNKGDLITVKVTDQKEEWWVSVVYMGVDGAENREENRKLYEALREISGRTGNGKWIVMGDFNGHIGLNQEPANRNGHMLLDFAETANLKIKNWELEDPVTWRDRGSASAIDYIMASEAVEKGQCGIWKVEELDISDHIMIGVTCRRGRREEQEQDMVAEWKTKWDTLNPNWGEYRKSLDEKLQEEVEKGNRTCDQWEKRVKEVIEEEAKATVGIKKYKVGQRKLKGWWDDEVEKAISDRKRENRKQRKLRKMTEKEGEQHRQAWEAAYRSYRKVQKATRVLINKKIANWEGRQAEKLNNLPRGEREKEGWKRLKRNLGGKEENREVILKSEGRETGNKEEVRSVVEGYWSKVMKTETRSRGPENLVIYSDRKEMDAVGIEMVEVEQALSRLKNGKAAGTDNIIGEFLKYGGDIVKQVIVNMSQSILEEGEVPQDWKRSRVTLIHKGGGKDKADIGNYRPIAITNTMAKVFGIIINEKLKTWMETQKVLGEEQSGFRKGRGGLDNIFTLKEIIDRNRTQKKELYLVFLDLEKAYDTVNRDKLFRLLRHVGVDRKIIRVIESLYEGNEVQFTLGDVTTGWVENNIGVRQGCVMSPMLFNLYLEELIVRIRKARIGVEIGGERLGCLTYADDVVLMAERKEEMEELLHIAHTYGREWDLKFSVKKCKVMEFGSEGSSQWVLGDTVLEVVDKFMYLGMEVSKEGIGGERQRRLNEGKARRMSGMIINGGSRVVNKYDIGRSLWKGVGVPYCLYGTEITYYREGDIAQLEKVQNVVGRWGLGAPRSTAVEAIRGDMGWSSFKERIVKGKLGFLKKIEQSSEERWMKKIMIDNGNKSTWGKELERWKRRENMREEWNEMGIRDVKKRVETNGLNRWQEGMNGKTTMKWYVRRRSLRE